MRSVERTVSPLLLSVLISLSAGGLIASDINLPGMPIAAHDLGVSVAAVQWTFSAYLVGLALAQALYGPLSDAVGRKPLITGGLTLFTAASVLCAFAPDILVFGAGRLLQALGAGAGIVVGRAMVSDLFDQKAAARVFTLIMPVVGVSPAVSPLVGGYLTTLTDWRVPFLVTAGLAALTLVAVVARVPESHPAGRRKRGVAATVGNYPRLLVQPRFWAYTVNLGAAYAAYFGYLAASPVIFHRMGLGTEATSYCYISVSVAYVLGNLFSRTLVRTRSLDRLLLWGHAVFTVGALALLPFGLAGSDNPWPLLLLMGVMTFGNGFLIPLSYAGGVAGFPTMAGAASGLLGALQMGTGSLAIVVVSWFSGGLLSLGWFMAAVAVLGVVGFASLLRAAGPVPAADEVRGGPASAPAQPPAVAEAVPGPAPEAEPGVAA
jgi:MFS transporter, DHA1 family, multidrug resistance protein